MSQTNKPRESVIIIGGGISGMAAGCYLQMNGFDTQIFERHLLPGGCCTAWSRKGYVFDYCIEWLLGSGPDNDANRVWRELGALDGKSVRNFDLFNRVMDEDGRSVTFYNDPDKLQRHLLELSPEDAEHIKVFCDDLRHFIRLNIFPTLKPNRLMTWREKMGLLATVLPSFRLFWRTGATQMETFAARFKHPLLKRAMPNIFFQDHECFPMLPYLYNMGQAFKGNAGFPQGGSLGLSKSIEKRYDALGGKIHYKAYVTRILVKHNRATGIELKKKTQHFADYVVSACDGQTALYEMLEGRFVNKTISKLYDDVLQRPGILYPGVVSTFVGFKGDAGQHDPHSTTYLLKPEVAAQLPGCKQNSLVIQHRSRYADGFAPSGHSVIHCTYLSDFDIWYGLRNNDKPMYRTRKREIVEFISAFLEQLYPGIRERIEIVEVATPVTMKRYTGNFKGAILGWKSFTQAEDLANVLVNKGRMQLPGLENFYMAGQWIGGGSLVRSALSGRYVAQYLCQDLKREFKISECNSSLSWDNSQIGQLPQLDEEAVIAV